MTIADLWRAAVARGEKDFDPERPCSRGHTSRRWTNSRICIECKRATDIAYNGRNVEAHRERSRRSAANRPEEVKAYRAKYYRGNEAVFKARSALWAMSNREHVRQVKRRWGLTNRDRLCERQALWRRANRETARGYGRKWKRRNPEQVKAAESLRRARTAGVETGCRRAYEAFVRWSQTARSIACYWCGRKTLRGGRHRDHVIPIAKGGPDTVANLCISCPSCNLGKNAKLPEEYSGQAELRLA